MKLCAFFECLLFPSETVGVDISAIGKIGIDPSVGRQLDGIVEADDAQRMIHLFLVATESQV